MKLCSHGHIVCSENQVSEMLSPPSRFIGSIQHQDGYGKTTTKEDKLFYFETKRVVYVREKGDNNAYPEIEACTKSTGRSMLCISVS